MQSVCSPAGNGVGLSGYQSLGAAFSSSKLDNRAANCQSVPFSFVPPPLVHPCFLVYLLWESCLCPVCFLIGINATAPLS